MWELCHTLTHDAAVAQAVNIHVLFQWSGCWARAAAAAEVQKDCRCGLTHEQLPGNRPARMEAKTGPHRSGLIENTLCVGQELTRGVPVKYCVMTVSTGTRTPVGQEHSVWHIMHTFSECRLASGVCDSLGIHSSAGTAMF